MRIGVDAASWFNERGYGRFTRELLSAMARSGAGHEFVYLVDRRDVDRLPPPGPSVAVRGVHLGERPVEAASADGSRSPADLFAMTRAAGAERLDVLFYPTVYTFFPKPRRVQAVVAVHDAIPERYPKLTLPSARARLFWRMKVALALRQARLVMTVSEFAAREIAEVLSVAPERIRVAGEAPAAAYAPGASADDVARAASRIGLPSGARWFTYVGGFNPHKNVDRLVRAHARLASELERPPHLVLCGTLDRDVFHADVRGIRAAGPAKDLVHWPGFVPDGEMRLLHTGALAVVLPSQSEGFGLPAVEAAACGTPVVATRASPLPELLEGGGIFVEPGDEDALAGALRRMADDEPARRAMGARALERASRLSWERAAERALAALEEAAQ